MPKQFYEQLLPSQGVYCASGIDNDGNITQRFAETLDDLINHVEKLKAKDLNVYVTPGSFKDYNRLAANVLAVRSFFLDLDVISESNIEKLIAKGKCETRDEAVALLYTKKYLSKEEALVALDALITEKGLPPPVVVDSGTGIQVYWIFDEDVSAAEWKAYADKFKAFCNDHIKHDPTVVADPSRYMRCPDTFNHKHSPPRPTKILSDEIHVYSFQMFREFLGVVDLSLQAILDSVQKGLDEETLKILKRDNQDTLFKIIAEKSLIDEGCAQIKYILVNAAALEEPLWRSGLSIARHCSDWEEAIHLMSEDYPGYNREATIAKANGTLDKPHSCEYIESINPGGCNGCPFRGKITNPLPIGRVIKEAPTAPENSVWTPTAAKTVPAFPAYLRPFFRGENGGVYYLPPPVVGKDGKTVQDEPIRLWKHDIFPVKRMFSPVDGECLLMRHMMPNDADREFILPMKLVYMQDEFKKILTSNGVLFHPLVTNHFMNYVIKWGQFLIDSNSAEQMRMQMGWTEHKDAFVIGDMEIDKQGEMRKAPPSPFVKGIAKLLKPEGSYEEWKTAANALNEPDFEMHAFTMLCGFGSPLMHMTSTSGVAVSLVGESGGAKTGALNSALSIFGNPKELSVFDATDNGMIGRYLGLHNLLLGCDEVSNKKADVLSNLIHRVSHGKAKIRMQASVNAERELELSASLIAIFTSNQSIYDKLTILKSRPDGEVARLVEFPIRHPRPLVVNPRRGKEIFDVFRLNYGHAGPDYVKYLFATGETRIRQLITKWSNKFAQDFGAEVAYRFYENLVAATFAAGELAVEAGIVAFDLDRIYRRVVLEMIAIRDETIKVNDVDYTSLISEFINKHHTSLLIFDGDRVTTEPRMDLVGRIEVHTGMQFVSKTVFKHYLNELQISSRQFEFSAKQSGALTFVGKKRLSSGWKAGMANAPISVYGFKTDIPEELLQHATE